MSGTEAVMCAVRLASFNTQRRLTVVFNGAYHGWWDGVQPGPGNERAHTDILNLKDMSPAALRVIQARAHEIACVLVNPVQGFNPNTPPPNDLVMLTSNVRKAVTVEDGYRAWLKQLRRVCSDVDVPLIFDEVRGYAMISLSLCCHEGV
jgi:glutamate-1-semialdehyde 2,1-aminomutase